MTRTIGSKASERNSSGRRSILIVGDHPVTRFGLSELIGREKDLFICGEAGNAPGAIELVQRHDADLAIVDLAHGTMGGIELIRGIRAIRPTTRVLVLSMQDENFFAERALRAGASGYVMKRQPLRDILLAIRRVLGGELHLSDRVKEKMLSRLVRAPIRDTRSAVDTLTDREMEVFQLIGNGYRTCQIAARLHLSVKTVDSHREHLKRKLGARAGDDLVRQAIQWGRSEAVSLGSSA